MSNNSETVCPKCFEKIEQAAYACHTPDCTNADLPLAGADTTKDDAGNPVCAACKNPLTARICPHCGYPLGILGDDAPRLPVVIAGASGSGKSNYLSVLIHTIKTRMSKVFDCSLYPVGGDATMRLYEEEYHRPLFVQGRVPAPTELDDIEPMDYSLVFSGQSRNGRTCNVSFYDSCGATFESERTTARYNRALPGARAIFLLIDPAQLPGVQDQFRIQKRPILEADPTELLSRVIQLIREAGNINSIQKKIQIPLAVCLTKLDTLEHLLDPSSFSLQQGRQLRAPRLDKADRAICDLEVRSLIESWAGRELLNQVRGQFSHFGFFALSALGSEPVGGTQINRVVPQRVLDPFLWMLWKNRIIDGQ